MCEASEDAIDNPIRRAIDLAGGVQSVSTACKLSKQAVYKWINGTVPANRVLFLEQATAGRVTRHELRPDLYPHESIPNVVSSEAGA